MATNIAAHGTGALNIDGCRVEHDGTGSWGTINRGDSRSVFGAFADEDGETPGSTRNDAGRWPANVLLDPEAAAMLDEQSGESVSTGGRIGKKEQGAVGNVPAGEYEAGDPGYGDSGGASRFFYCAKASRGEREAGLEEMAAGITDDGRATPIDNPYLRGQTSRRNVHPTVKPIDLMRWLVRLVTPPGETVLDPFAGSGTTGIAAHLEGFAFIGIEREAEYAEIAQARIKHWQRFPVGTDAEAALESASAEAKVRDTGQLSLSGE